MTEYAGLDYSHGMSNYNTKTGIHYGIIPHSAEVSQAWADSSEPYYIPACPSCGYTFKKSKYPKRCPSCGYHPQDESEFFADEPNSFIYKSNGYALESDETDIWVFKGPFYTFAQYASPCAPGAVYLPQHFNLDYDQQKIFDKLGLESNRKKSQYYIEQAENAGFPKAYCLGHDWFDSEYTGNWIDCKYCKGTGLRKKASIPNYDEQRFIANGGTVFGDNHVYCWSCRENEKYGMIGKVKETIQKAPYTIFSVKTNLIINPTTGD